MKKVYKRIKKDQTTEYAVTNPINDLNDEISLFNYYIFLYLEYEGNKLSTLSKLKESDELSLKLFEIYK